MKKCPGPDSLREFLRRYAELVSKYLGMVFLVSLCTGALPDNWRTARIVPVYKLGDHNCVNYRPISLNLVSYWSINLFAHGKAPQNK